jgi:hypothetical protein
LALNQRLIKKTLVYLKVAIIVTNSHNSYLRLMHLPKYSEDSVRFLYRTCLTLMCLSAIAELAILAFLKLMIITSNVKQ